MAAAPGGGGGSSGGGGSGGGGVCTGAAGLLLALLALTALSTRCASAKDWADCPSICKCKWSNSRKVAECPSAGLTTVPDTLSTEIQVLDLSGNDFPILPEEAFFTVGLKNLQKLFLKSCGIKTLHKAAFRKLEILIELDLSNNSIVTLHHTTFTENYRLRVLYLNRNPLEKLDGEMFSNHIYLQTVGLSDCRLQHLGPKLFSNTPVLQNLMLDGNQLSYLRLTTVASLDKLKSLVLSKNPWRCDCRLRPLLDWVIERKLYADPTACVEPERLREKRWNDLKSEEFACRPQLVLPSTNVAVAPGSNITLSCRAAGDPSPTVQWILNSIVLGNSTRAPHSGYHQHYTVRRGESRNAAGEYWTWTNLTIHEVRPHDSGKYSCGAKNPGGVAEEVLMLGVREGAGGYMGASTGNTLWTWLIALVVAAFLLLLLVLLLCVCLCRRSKGRRGHRGASGVGGVVIKKHDAQLTSNGDLNTGEDDQEKALITKINPLQKPPRRLESAQSSVNGSQTTELNRSHLLMMDEDMTSSGGGGATGGGGGGGGQPRTRGSEGSAGENSHSDELLLGRSYDSLDSEPEPTPLPSSSSLLPVNHQQHHAMPLASPQQNNKPQDGRTFPDLLAFPPRATQDSPAGSSSSTVPDSTRLPLQHTGGPQSPILVLPPHAAGFGTLPYARSQSPFSPSMSAQALGSCGSLPVVTTRQGYVTIPRRPRAPSWAAPPRPGDPLLKVEPLYDNLGPRTTADGSSVLSLNKTGEGGGGNNTLTKVTPNRNAIRPLPPTPQSHLITPLPTYYAPIEELDPVPSPAPTRHKMNNTATLPSQPPATLPKSEEARKKRGSYSRTSPEGSSVNRALPREDVTPSPRSVGIADSSPIAAVVTNGPRKTSTPKIPPKVPPKPKKRPANGGVPQQSDLDPSLSGVEPLYEAEGEDGTEV